jgi:hypothetical protein
LIHEAWETKLAADALDYGNRLMAVAEKVAVERNMSIYACSGYRPTQRMMLLKVNYILFFSLAKWLIFYEKMGTGMRRIFRVGVVILQLANFNQKRMALKDGDSCKVIAGTHKGKSGLVRDINTSKTGHITITVVQVSGLRFKTLAKNVEMVKTKSKL